MPKRVANAALGVFSFAACSLFATAAGLPGLEPKLLPPEQAFHFSARALDDHTLEGRFDVANGYYLYRDKLRFAIEPTTQKLDAAELPNGMRKHDEFFGDVEIYRGAVSVKLPLQSRAAGQSIILIADSQGCADAGVCYPPTRQQVRIVVPAAGAGAGARVEAAPRKGLFD